MSLECGRSSIKLDPAFPAGAAGAAGAEHDADLAGRGRAGTHDMLSQADGLYAELFRLQARGLRFVIGTWNWA